MFPLGDAQPVHIMPSDPTTRLSVQTEHHRETADRPSQLQPHVGRLRRVLQRLGRRGPGGRR
jgi:hypothetical protein